MFILRLWNTEWNFRRLIRSGSAIPKPPLNFADVVELIAQARLIAGADVLFE